MPRTYKYPGKLARYEAAALYLLVMFLLFGVHIAYSDQLFPDTHKLQEQLASGGEPAPACIPDATAGVTSTDSEDE